MSSSADEMWQLTLTGRRSEIDKVQAWLLSQGARDRTRPEPLRVVTASGATRPPRKGGERSA